MAVRSVSNSSITGDERTDSLSVAYRQSVPLSIEYLVIGGGASGGYTRAFSAGGGGGAGGYRCSVSGESSGGGASAESPVAGFIGVEYPLTVGAGGAASGGTFAIDNGNYGFLSRFGSVIARGGGGGNNSAASTLLRGGSGGGGASVSNTVTGTGGIATANQGYDGGDGLAIGTSNRGAGGGGGAGAVGVDGASDVGGNGGNGVTSSVTGTSVTRAGGGGGCTSYNSVAAGGATQGSGGSGGGGSAVASTSTSNATSESGAANTGGGGGGVSQVDPATYTPGYSGAGGSGIVILKYPKEYVATFSAGVTVTTSTIGDYKVSQITATSTVSETVMFT